MTSPQSTVYSFELPDYPADFVSSGFFQAEILSGLVPTNCTFEIHKMFARKNFPSDEFDYDKLELSLRLTSALMTAALPIFHAILVKGASCMGTTTDDGKTLFSFPEPVEILSPEELYTTWRRLDHVAEGLSFHMGGTDQISSAWCKRCHNLYVSLGPGLPGCGSKIQIGQGLYDSVIKFYSEETDLISKQASSFNFASTLIHELTHAAVNAATPFQHAIRDVQYFLGDSAYTTEVGFETESWLFGGVTICQPFQGYQAYFNEDTDKTSHLDYLLTVTEYPCPSKTLLYEQYPDRMIVRGGQKSTEIIWHASFLHIHKLFQDDFWKKVFPKHGRRALLFEKNTGFRFMASGNDYKLRPVLPDADDQVDLPPGYSVDETGMIRRKVDQVAQKKKKEKLGFGL